MQGRSRSEGESDRQRGGRGPSVSGARCEKHGTWTEHDAWPVCTTRPGHLKGCRRTRGRRGRRAGFRVCFDRHEDPNAGLLDGDGRCPCARLLGADDLDAAGKWRIRCSGRDRRRSRRRGNAPGGVRMPGRLRDQDGCGVPGRGARVWQCMRAGQRRMGVCPAVPLRGWKTVRLAFGPRRVRAVLSRVLRFAPRWRAGWDRRRGGRGRNRRRRRFQRRRRCGRNRRREWDRRLVRKRGDRPVWGRPGMLRPGGQLLQFRRAATPVVQTRRHLPRGSLVRHVLPFLHVSHDSSDQRRAAWDMRYLRERRRLRSAPSLPR